jgi:hypothetical protein
MRNGVVTSLLALGVGSALMYYWDPTNGRRRRDRARQLSKRTMREARKMADATAKRLDRVKDMDWSDLAKILVPVTAKALLG